MDRKRQKAEINLEAMVSGGQASAYEALQLYRSRCNRMKQKNDYMGAISTAAKGAVGLFANNYINAATELSSIMVSLLVDSGLDITPDIRNLVNEVDNAFADCAANNPPIGSTASAGENTEKVSPPQPPTGKNNNKPSVETSGRIEYLKSLVAYSIKHGQREYGDPMFHTQLAGCLWEFKSTNLPPNHPTSTVNPNAFGIYHRKSTYHFAVGEAPVALWNKILEGYSTPESTEDVALARERERLVVIGILQFLALENLRDANILYKAYATHIKSKKPSGKKNKKGKNKENPESVGDATLGMFDDPELMKFCDMLLQTVTRDAAPLFKNLCNSFNSHLTFDPVIPSLLMGPIASKLFNIQASTRPMPGANSGIMAMMQNMLGGQM